VRYKGIGILSETGKITDSITGLDIEGADISITGFAKKVIINAT